MWIRKVGEARDKLAHSGDTKDYILMAYGTRKIVSFTLIGICFRFDTTHRVPQSTIKWIILMKMGNKPVISLSFANHKKPDS